MNMEHVAHSGAASEKQKLSLDEAREAEALFKDMHMSGRAMRVDESVADYQREREESWSGAWEKIKEEKGWAAPQRSKERDIVDEQGPTIPVEQERDARFAHVPPERRELAKTLAVMSQDEYAEWLSQHLLEEKDIYSQLVARPEYRALTNAERAAIFIKFKGAPESVAYERSVNDLDQFWLLMNRLGKTDSVRTIGSGDKWNNFQINKGTTGRHAESKGYLTLKNPVEDLTPSSLNLFMQKLQEDGYNGQVKVPTIVSGLLFRFDNVVFHGDTDQDVEKALRIAKELFAGKLTQTQKGVDGTNAEGKHTSHSDLLADRVQKARNAAKQ